MKQYKGMGRVFSFTLIQQVRQKGWRTTTLLLALASLIIRTCRTITRPTAWCTPARMTMTRPWAG